MQKTEAAILKTNYIATPHDGEKMDAMMNGEETEPRMWTLKVYVLHFGYYE